MRSPVDVKTFMIATGEAHQKMAELTVPRVERCAGVKVEVLTEGDPFELKMCLLERADSSVFFVDADAVMLGWDWEPFKLPGFNVCLDSVVHPAFLPFEDRPRISIDTGMFLVSSDYLRLYEKAKDAREELLRKRKFPGHVGDQTAMNLAIGRSSKLSINILPQKFNWPILDVPERGKLPEGTLLAHVLGPSQPLNTTTERSPDNLEAIDVSRKLELVIDFCKRFPIRESKYPQRLNSSFP